MTGVDHGPRHEAGTPGTGRASLLAAELHRVTARRFVRALAAVAVLGLLLAAGIAFTQHARASDAALARAEAQLQEQIRVDREFREQCLQDENRPADVPVEDFCGPVPTAEGYDLGAFIDPPPFRLAQQLPDGAVTVAIAGAAIGFLLGATYVGAEWSTRSMVALLFWEPRRWRVVGVKVAVTALAAAVLAVVMQALWLAAALVLGSTRGTTEVPAGFWPDLLAQQARGVLLVVLVALLGFAVANLIRGTGAALGLGFVYLAIVENALGVFVPRAQEWLVSSNVGALVVPGGLTISVEDEGTIREVVLGPLHGGLTLGAYTAALLLLGGVLFARRDLH